MSKIDLHERTERRFVVSHSHSLDERRAVERDSGVDPRPVDVTIEVTISADAPPATAAELLRALADTIEQGV